MAIFVCVMDFSAHVSRPWADVGEVIAVPSQLQKNIDFFFF